MPPLRLPKISLAFVGVFSFIGFVDAAYLTAAHYLKLPLPCNVTDGCDTVLSSSYSMIGPVPLAALGALYYLSMFLLSVYLYTSEEPKVWNAGAIWGISLIGLFSSSYLFYLQAAVIYAFCLYCLGSTVTTILLFISASVLLWKMRHQNLAASASETKTPAL